MTTQWLSRQGFLGSASDITLDRARVGVIGLGGGGSHIIQQLAHAGVGNFELFDPDHIEETNLNRVVGATFADVESATAKTVVAEHVIRAVNPRARVVAHANDWRARVEYVRTCDVVFGCVDSFIARSEIEVTCRRYLIPYIDIGMDVFPIDKQFSIAGQVIVSMPGQLCMRCMGFLREDLLAREAERYGAAGGRPQVVWPNGFLASTAVGLFIELLTPWHAASPKSVFLEYDGNVHTLIPANVLAYMGDKVCPHFTDPSNLGDPFFTTAGQQR
jgi:hypothetical protein